MVLGELRPLARKVSGCLEHHSRRRGQEHPGAPEGPEGLRRGPVEAEHDGRDLGDVDVLEDPRRARAVVRDEWRRGACGEGQDDGVDD